MSTALSWCKTEVRVSSPKMVTKLTDKAPDSPPLCVMSLHLQTVLNDRDKCNEIVMLSALVHPEVSLYAHAHMVSSVACVVHFSPLLPRALTLSFYFSCHVRSDVYVCVYACSVGM